MCVWGGGICGDQLPFWVPSSLYPEHLLRDRLSRVIRFFRRITETITVLALGLYKPRIDAQISSSVRREQNKNIIIHFQQIKVAAHLLYNANVLEAFLFARNGQKMKKFKNSNKTTSKTHHYHTYEKSSWVFFTVFPLISFLNFIIVWEFSHNFLEIKHVFCFWKKIYKGSCGNLIWIKKGGL